MTAEPEPSETPRVRTDAATQSDCVGDYVHVDFARGLERALTAIRIHHENHLESDSIVASCNCLTKTPEVRFHKPGCKYRLISERDRLAKELSEEKNMSGAIRADRIMEVGRIAKELEEAHMQKSVRDKILQPSFCGVPGHFRFQQNGSSCLMCQREWMLAHNATTPILAREVRLREALIPIVEKCRVPFGFVSFQEMGCQIEAALAEKPCAPEADSK